MTSSPPIDLFPDQPKKFCVFCGQPPEAKNREHIIPQWLIKMTGTPSRKADVALIKSKGQRRNQSWLSFAFPACSQCNSTYSALEARAKKVTERLLEGLPTEETEFAAFLDWLDKVRIGLWLADMMLNQDFIMIRRHFHISDRIGRKDRCVHIFKAPKGQKGIGIAGMETMAFHFAPCCFCLIVNELYFLNVSHDFLFSHRLGAPIITEQFIDPETGKVGGELKAVRANLQKPLVKKASHLVHTTALQACTQPEVQGTPEQEAYLESELGRTLFPDKSSKSRILLNNGRLAFEHGASTLRLDLLNEYPGDFLNVLIPHYVFQLQNQVIKNSPSFERLDKETRRRDNMLKNNAMNLNNKFIESTTESLKYFDINGNIK